jgi:hypothetical protein
MRTCTYHVANHHLPLGCSVDLRFDDVPDNGPGDSILNIIASNEAQAMAGIQSAIDGIVLQGPVPLPVTTVFDQEGLDSLTMEQFVQATRVDVKVR